MSAHKTVEDNRASEIMFERRNKNSLIGLEGGWRRRWRWRLGSEGQCPQSRGHRHQLREAKAFFQ